MRNSLVLICLWLCLAGCTEEPPSRTIYSTPHKFDANLQGLQRLWAQQAEQRLAAGITLLPNNLPDNVTPSADVVSATGRFRGHLEPPPSQISGTGRISFNLLLEANVEPIPGQITLSVAGGMPLHSHGLPTQPTITSNANGTIEIKGVRFSMPGWWQLAIGVEAEAESDFDMLIFDFFVAP